MEKALPRAEVVAAIEGRPLHERIPVMIHLWVHPDTFGERRAAVEALLARYPQDVNFLQFRMPDLYNAPPDAPGYRWMNCADPYAGTETAIDARVALRDWNQLDAVLADFPDPRYPGLVYPVAPDDGRYRLGHWWFCLFERHWSLRGMTNALLDYYTDPDQVHRLFRALTDFYKGVIARGREAWALDGIFTSDDIGTQTGPFFSPEIFRTFFKPYYRELIEHTHRLGMHFWLHSCGGIEPFLPDLVEIGLDVLHPVQKHTMDERRVAAQFGRRLCIWAGLDVQQVIPWGTPEEVRREVRHLIDTYHAAPGSRLMLTAGNGINGDCTLASLEAFFDEALRYGRAVVARGQ